MIIFKLTFLLSLNKSSEDTKEKKLEVNEENKEGNPEEEAEVKDYELKIGNFITSMRIEYELLPKKFKYSVELSCWRNVAKV